MGELAQRLAGLESRRAEVASRLAAAKQSRQEAAARGGNAQGRAELGKLQDRLQRADASLLRLRVGRSEQIGRLERAERLLASCERSLEGLSLRDDGPAVQPVETASSSVETAPAATEAPAPMRSRIGPEEAAARQEVQDLTRELELAGKAQVRARQALADGRAHVERVRAAAERIVEPQQYLDRIDQASQAMLAGYLEHIELPPAGQLPGRNEADTRHEQYLARFTEVDAQGALRLTAEVAEHPRVAFSAVSAIFAAISPTHQVDSLLVNLLRGDQWPMEEITAAIREGGDALEGVLRVRIIDGMAQTQRLSEVAAQAAAGAQQGRRHGQLMGVNIRRSELAEIGLRNRQVAEILSVPGHRMAIIEGAVAMASTMLRIVARDYAETGPLIAQAQADFEQTKAAQRPAFQRSVDAERALEAAKAKVRTLAEERRREETAAAKAAEQSRARPSEASIPQTEIASTSSGTDAESRVLKLRGDIEKHTEAAEAARQELAQSDEQIRQAEAEVRRAEDQLETAAAAQARRSAGARRQHGQQREELAQLRRELAEIDAGIATARAEIHSAPSRQALISDRAWERAIERHVEPDDAALRARARITGYAGAYGSHADLAQATADIHDHVSQQPEFQAVLAATSRAEFERAAAALPGGVTDLVHDHGRPIGRGFSNDLDQTERATTLTQSNFSLQFVQGRVVISHLYPYVPHRQLATAV